MDTPQLLVYNPSQQLVSLAGSVRDRAFGVREARTISQVLRSGWFGQTDRVSVDLFVAVTTNPSLELKELLLFIKTYKPGVPVWLVAPTARQLDSVTSACRGLFSLDCQAADLSTCLTNGFYTWIPGKQA